MCRSAASAQIQTHAPEGSWIGGFWSNDTNRKNHGGRAGDGRDRDWRNTRHIGARGCSRGSGDRHRYSGAGLLLWARLLPAWTLLWLRLLLQRVLRLSHLWRRSLHRRALGLWAALLSLVGRTAMVLASRWLAQLGWMARRAFRLESPWLGRRPLGRARWPNHSLWRSSWRAHRVIRPRRRRTAPLGLRTLS